MAIGLVIFSIVAGALILVSLMAIAFNRMSKKHELEMERWEALHEAKMDFLEAGKSLAFVKHAKPGLIKELTKMFYAFTEDNWSKSYSHLQRAAFYTCPDTVEEWKKTHQAFLEMVSHSEYEIEEV